MAMPRHLTLEFVTPDRAVARQAVDEAELPGDEGFFGVLPGHAPVLAALKTGPMWYRSWAEKLVAFIAGGFAEVARYARPRG